MLKENVRDTRMRTWFHSTTTLGLTLGKGRDLIELDVDTRALVIIYTGMEDVVSGQAAAETTETARIKLEELLQRSQWHCYLRRTYNPWQRKGDATAGDRAQPRLEDALQGDGPTGRLYPSNWDVEETAVGGRLAVLERGSRVCDGKNEHQVSNF